MKISVVGSINIDMVVTADRIPLKGETLHGERLDLCYANDIPVLLNPAPARDVDKNLIDKLTYLTPNEHEVSLIFGNENDCQKALEKYQGKLLVTQGSEGVLVHEGGENLLVPARKSKVADTTGAGDTFNGVFAARIVAGDELTQAIAYANVAAGLSVEKHGAQGGMPKKEIVDLECGK